jgi:3-methyladenine DNA glycosylase AlkD
MTLKQTLAALKKAGTAQNRKIYGRHGVTGAMCGVSYAELKKLTKAIGTDHELARGLWASGNHDARVLACMVADPAALKSGEIDAWARAMDNYVLTDAFCGLIAQSRFGRSKCDAWMKRRDEWYRAAGWNLLSILADSDDSLTDAYLAERTAAIVTDIHGSPNRARHSMNQALIAIGIRNDKLRKRALAAAKKIGKVEVDHGQTSCQTPDASAYIAKVLDYRRKKAEKKAAK